MLVQGMLLRTLTCTLESSRCNGAGPPQLMMAFTADGQLDPELLASRDKICNVDSGARGRVRSAAFQCQSPCIRWRGVATRVIDA